MLGKVGANAPYSHVMLDRLSVRATTRPIGPVPPHRSRKHNHHNLLLGLLEARSCDLGGVVTVNLQSKLHLEHYHFILGTLKHQIRLPQSNAHSS